MSSAVLRTNDRTSVNGNTRRSGDKSSIRNVTARFKQFGHTVRMAEVRGMERFGHPDREGTTRKQAKVAVSQECAWGIIHSPLISSHLESKTLGSSVFWWNWEACVVKTSQMNYGWRKAFVAGLLQTLERMILLGVISEAEIKR